ncbi:keratin-associated protein 17-1 [Lonchura striata]
MIYSSGRESYFNLNSTWYDPSGSWLDTRRTPFRYGYATCCSSGCHGEGAEGMRGHDYRHYGYRQPRCAERCHGYAGSSGSCHGGGGSCVRRPTYSYGGSGGCQGYGRSVCSERCQGSVAQGGKPCLQSIPVQTCPCPRPPPIQQGCVPVAKGIPRQQQKQICKVPARKMK